VIDPQTQLVLQEIVRRESRSLLIYVKDAYPWTTQQGQLELGVLLKVIREESAAVTNLGRYLVRRKVTPPLLGQYPAQFTACNFIDLGYLLPRLLETQQQAITELQADLSKVNDPDARLQAEGLLAVKKRTLGELNALAGPQTQMAST